MFNADIPHPAPYTAVAVKDFFRPSRLSLDGRWKIGVLHRIVNFKKAYFLPRPHSA